MICKKIVRGKYKGFLEDGLFWTNLHIKGNENPSRIEDLLKEFVDKDVKITIEVETWTSGKGDGEYFCGI